MLLWITIGDVMMELGSLSAKYESNGNPGAISTGVGDKGGKSYGMYQLSLATGALAGYIASSAYKEEFNGIALGSNKFDAVWRAIAQRDPAGFRSDQRTYHTKVYYTPVRRYATSINIPNTEAINQVIWSMSTQHGPRWAKSILELCVGYSETETIKKIYELRTAQFMNSSYYGSSSSRKRVRDSVINRFKKELSDALEMVSG